MYNNVYIRKSLICDGLGIFANKNMMKDKIITWYYRFVVDYNKIKYKKYQNNKYIIEYSSIDKIKSLIGISDIDKIKGKGLAQLANDAIYFNLTHKYNNSYFIQKGRYIFLISLRNIKKHEEILASYGIDYWLKEIKNKHNIKNNIYNYKFKKTINILYYLTKLIKEYFLCDAEIRKIEKNNEIFFDINEKKRWCINYNIWHYDDDFYILFKKSNEENIKEVYYKCKSCNDQNLFLIDKINIDINLYLKDDK